MDLKIQLSKVTVNKLLNLIGKQTTDLLQKRGLKQFNSQSLADILIKINGERNLLSNKKILEVLIDTFKPEEIFKIIQELKLKKNNDPWGELKKQKFNKGSKEIKLLCNFFNISNEINYENDTDLENPKVISPIHGMFPYQMEAIKEVNEIIKNKKNKRLVLHMPTGAGKTRTAMSIITNFIKDQGDKSTIVVWLAHTEELCQQAHDEFISTWEKIGNRRFSVYKLFKKHRHPIQKINDGIIIMSLDLAYTYTKNDQTNFLSLSRKTNFIVMDEAHMAVAPSYKQVLDLLYSKTTVLIGLTATPGRSYLNLGEDIKLRDFFNKQKITIKIKGYNNPILYLQESGYLAKTEYFPIETNLDIASIFTKKEINDELNRIKNGQDLSEKFIKKISEDTTRTNIIVEQIKKESLNPNNKIIVFGSSLENIETIYSILYYENIKSACITGKTDSNLRNTYINQFKDMESGLNILLNYGVLTTGFDAPKANIAIIGRPTQSVSLYSQMVGRVMRGPEAKGKKVCKVITVKDPIHGFRDMGESFNYWEDIWQ